MNWSDPNDEEDIGEIVGPGLWWLSTGEWECCYSVADYPTPELITEEAGLADGSEHILELRYGYGYRLTKRDEWRYSTDTNEAARHLGDLAYAAAEDHKEWAAEAAMEDAYFARKEASDG